MKTWWLVLTVLCLVVPSSGFAQQARYQLGKQVIGFETAFQQSMSQLESRKAVLPSLERAVQAFFSMSFSGAEKSIDDAWLKLLPEEQQAEIAPLMPLRLSLAKHWHDTNTAEMEIALSAAYESKTARRLPFDIEVEFKDRHGKAMVSQTKTVSALPYKDVVSIKDLSEGDWECCVTVISNQVRWTLPSQIVSCTNALEERLIKAKESFESTKSKDPNTQQRSQQLMLNLLRDLKNGRDLETDFPAHQLLVTVEQWDNAAGALPQLEGSLLEGQYWLNWMAPNHPRWSACLYPRMLCRVRVTRFLSYSLFMERVEARTCSSMHMGLAKSPLFPKRRVTCWSVRANL